MKTNSNTWKITTGTWTDTTTTDTVSTGTYTDPYYEEPFRLPDNIKFPSFPDRDYTVPYPQPWNNNPVKNKKIKRTTKTIEKYDKKGNYKGKKVITKEVEIDEVPVWNAPVWNANTYQIMHSSGTGNLHSHCAVTVGGVSGSLIVNSCDYTRINPDIPFTLTSSLCAN